MQEVGGSIPPGSTTHPPFSDIHPYPDLVIWPAAVTKFTISAAL